MQLFRRAARSSENQDARHPPYPPHPTHLPHSPPSAVQVHDDKFTKPPLSSSYLTILSLVKCASVCCLFTVSSHYSLAHYWYRSIYPLVDPNNLPITFDSDLGRQGPELGKAGEAVGAVKGNER